jgi:Thioredoxin domain-containing protein
LYLDTLIHLKKYEEVKSFISSLSDDLQKSDSIKSTLTNLEIKEKEGSGPSIEELKINLKKDPKNIDALIDLSEKYFVGSMYDESFDLLLKSYSNNNSKDKEKIKKIILKYFDALGVENDITKTYRRKLSTIMFS